MKYMNTYMLYLTYILYLITIIASSIAFLYFNKSEETKYWSYMSILVTLSSLLYLMGIVLRDIGYYHVYTIFYISAGLVYLSMIFVLFITVHKKLYTRVGEAIFSVFPFPLPIILGKVITKSILYVIFTFIGIAFVLTSITVYMTVTLALERKGGSFFWYLISGYATLIFLTILLTGLFMFLEEIGIVVEDMGILIHSMLYAISSVVLLVSAWYYEKVLQPKIQRLKQL